MDRSLPSSTSDSLLPTNSQPLKVLIADDDRAALLLLKTLLEKQGTTVITTMDGRQACETFKRERPDVVLLDAIMPKMDGFEAAINIKQLAGEHYVPVIFLTSLQETDLLARCLEVGDDFLTKPYSNVILKAKLNAFKRVIEMHHTLREQRDEIIANNHRLLREQEVAKRVFDKVAHAGCLDAPNIKYALSPIAVFNGDVALAGVGPSGNLLVLLADFTGHGLNAAIGAMPMAQAFYSMLDKGFGLRDIIKEINSKLHEILPVGVFCCALVAEIDFNSQLLQVWNGGLPDGVIYRPGVGIIHTLTSKHLPLGIRSPREFNTQGDMYEVQPNDRLFMWSDGIIETEGDDGEMYGEERLLQLFAANSDPDTLFRDINLSVNTFIGEGAQADDVSIIEVKVVTPEEFPIEVEDNTVFEDPGPKDWSLFYEMRPETLKTFDPLPLMRHIFLQVPFLRALAGQIYTVMSELYSNALEHGVLQLDSAMKSSPSGFSDYYRLRGERLQQLESGMIAIGLSYNGSELGGKLVIEIQDSGDGFDYKHWLHEAATRDEPQSQQYSGRGIHLLRSLCKRIDYNAVGNHVTAEFHWGDVSTVDD